MKRGLAIFILLILLQAEALLDTVLEECCETGDWQMPDSSFNFLNFTGNGDISSTGTEDGSDGGLLILIPEMSFGCSGIVTGWRGLVSSVSTLEETFLIHLQIWRPVYEGRYDLIGEEAINFTDFMQEDIIGYYDDDSTEHERTQYHPFHKEEGNAIPFQQGDIIGFFIPPCPSMNLGEPSQKSLGLAFRNIPAHEQESMVDLIVFDGVSGEPCEVFGCKRTPRIISSVVPLVYPHCRATAKWSSGSGSSFVPIDDSDHIIATPLCEASTTSCTDEESGGESISGLFAVIAGVCIGTVCLVGIAANIVTFFLARRRFKRTGQERHMVHNGTESACPFVINKQTQPEDNEECELEKRRISNINSLADFLQYTMQIDEENTNESNRMSWV